MPDELKPVLAQEMEVYAGFLEHVDYHAGRLIDVIDDLGVLDNTIIYYIIGDNGALVFGRNELLPGADVAVSVMLPIPTEW